jgi:hypothetical protein
MILSEQAEAALILFSARKVVAGRIEGVWGSWWILDGLMWQIIDTLSQSEHDVMLAILDAYNLRNGAKYAA